MVNNRNFSIKKKDEDVSLSREMAGELLKEFFVKRIVQEVPNVEIVILITKKSFWSYQLNRDKAIEKEIGFKVYSDRYFLKLLDFRKYNGKNIVIVDDTMNTGVALESFFELMVENCPKSEIIKPFVCLLSNEFEKNIYIKNQRFLKQLKSYREVSPARIGQMCIHETLSFHEQLVPYIVDLPVIQQKQNNRRWNHIIKMSQNDFMLLCKGNNAWTFYKTDYEIIPGKMVEAGFFVFHNSFLEFKFDSFLLNAIIKVQYRFDEVNEQVEVVFTPFALFNSVNANEMKTCFDAIFEGTDYKKKFTEVKDNLKKNYYTALYRSVVYVISMYIGVKFIEFMESDKPMRLYNDNHFISGFYKAINSIFPPENNYGEFNEIDFLSKIMKLPFENEGVVKYRDVLNKNITISDNYTDRDWFALLYENIILTKRYKDEKKYIKSEELEALICEKGDIAERKVLMTKVLLEALNKSILSNCLDYDEYSNIIYRGYRYGENTELLLPYDARIFYQGILVYYERVETKRYYEKLNYFLINFKDFLQRNGLYNLAISEKEFHFFSVYFSEIPEKDIETQIRNKEYLLDENYCAKSAFMKQTLLKVEDFARDIDLGEEA